MRSTTCLAAVSLVIGLGFVAGTAEAVERETETVNCPADSIQSEVNEADRPTTIFVTGTCVEDVSITTDDITLSGNEAGAACNKADPSVSASGTIDGTITVDGVRARIEHLVVTGSGGGVTIVNRADVRLVCNDISNNEAEGVAVVRSSNAVLRDNTLSGNGTRTSNPLIFFDCGLFAGDASSVNSRGNTYKDNQYCAIEADRQSAFRSGSFIPRAPEFSADPAERDLILERGCDPATGAGCFTNDFSTVAVEVFNGGLVDLRNAEVGGKTEVSGLSSLRVDGEGKIQGNIEAGVNSIVRIKNRNALNRNVSYTGTLSCFGQSLAFFSDVQCGQTCSGLDASGNLICTP